MDMKCAKYTAIYAKTNTGYSAHIPDLPGCIATGRTLELTKGKKSLGSPENDSRRSPARGGTASEAGISI